MIKTMKNNILLWVTTVTVFALAGCGVESQPQSTFTLGDGTKLTLDCQQDLLGETGFVGGGTCFGPGSNYTSITAYAWDDGIEVLWQVYENNVMVVAETRACTTRTVWTGTNYASCEVSGTVTHDAAGEIFTMTNLQLDYVDISISMPITITGKLNYSQE